MRDPRIKNDPDFPGERRFHFYYRLNPHPAPPEHRSGFTSIADATAALRELEAAKAARRPAPGGRKGLTVGEYLTDVWLPSLAVRVLTGVLKQETVDGYERNVRLHITPDSYKDGQPAGALGKVKLAALDGDDVDAMIGRLAMAGMKPNSLRAARTALSSALADGVPRYLPHNPVKLSRLSVPAETVTDQSWNAEEAQAFLAYVAGDRQEALWRYFLATGCRLGEATGLRWRKIDLTRGVVTIDHQRTARGGGRGRKNKKPVSIPLDAETLALLRQWRKIQAAGLLRLGARNDGDYVFTGTTGRPLWNSVVERRFNRLRHKSRVHRITIHGLRRTAATLMLDNGVPVQEVADRLGDTKATILRNYAHHLGDGTRAANVLGEVLSVKRSPQRSPDLGVIPLNRRSEG